MQLSMRVGQRTQLSVIAGDFAGNQLPLRMPAVNDQPQTKADKTGRSGAVLQWKTTAPDIVQVDVKGMISAKAAGKATILATAGDLTGSAAVNVLEEQKELSISPSSATLLEGASLRMNLFNQGGIQSDKIASWRVDHPEVLHLSGNGVATAKAPGRTNLFATYEEQTAVSSLHVVPARKISGLDFPGNKGVQHTLRFEFKKPLQACPATFIWRAYPRQQRSYYTAMFWGNRGRFYPQATYYGFHPYPDWKEDYQHFWEIAAPPGQDHVSRSHVVYDRWYIQAAVCELHENSVTHTFFYDWPENDAVLSVRNERTEDPPSPVLVVGDAPWNAGNEVWDGILRGFQFYGLALTDLEIAEEIATPGATHMPWYLNINPQPTNISDQSGSGNHPAWVGYERPQLWTASLSEEGVILPTVTHD